MPNQNNPAEDVFLTIRIVIDSVFLIRIANQPRFVGIGLFPKKYKKCFKNVMCLLRREPAQDLTFFRTHYSDTLPTNLVCFGHCHLLHSPSDSADLSRSCWTFLGNRDVHSTLYWGPNRTGRKKRYKKMDSSWRALNLAYVTLCHCCPAIFWIKNEILLLSLCVELHLW